MREGKTEEMLATYERLLSLDPNQATAYNSLGYHYIGRRDFVKGEDYLKRYRFLAPDQANPYDSLGELYANTGRYDEAEEHLKRALEIRPDFFQAIGHLGTLEVGRGNPEAAAGYFRRAAEMSEIVEGQAHVRRRRGDGAPRRGASGRRARDARRGRGRPADVLVEGGLLLPVSRDPVAGGRPRARGAGRGGRDGAGASPRRSRRSRGEGEGGARRRAFSGRRAAIAGARGDLEGAVRTLRELLSDEKESEVGSFPYYPGTFRLRVRLADALVTLGRPDEAREELRPVLAVNPRFAPALAVIARIEGRADGDAKGSAGR